MKRFACPLFASALLFAGPITGLAQNDAEEIRRLNSTTEALTEGQESLRGQIQTLRQEIANLRAENSALKQQLAGVGHDNVSRAELAKIVEQIREVDTKRQSDAQLVQRQLKEIAELASKPITVPEAPRIRERPPETKAPEKKNDNQPALPTEGYEHVVASGENIGTILQAYNQKYQLKVKTADVLRANPKLKDPKKLFVGQKLWIPEIK
jgi:chromosome segregation ATPase